MTNRKTVALALGSGGARGYAHIGAIQVIEERGFEIVSIAGSSMGALVGGLHAAGKLDGYTDWVMSMSQLDVVRLLDISLSGPGAIRAEKIVARVRELLDGALIEELPIDYTAVAVDLVAAREVWFQKGLVETAIRASIAIPGVITPVMLNGRLLADGGILNPIPLAPTAAARADLTLAIAASGEYHEPSGSQLVRATAEDQPVEEWSDRFRRTVDNLMDRDLVRSIRHRWGGDAQEPEDDELRESSANSQTEFERLPDGLSKLDVMNLSMDAMQKMLNRYRLAGYPPDLVVNVPADACRTLDFHRADELIPLGRKLTTDALDRAGLKAADLSSAEETADPATPGDDEPTA